MCGRYTFRELPDFEFTVPAWGKLWAGVNISQARYNIAPSQLAPVVTAKGVKDMSFGMKPEWSKSGLINAKAENLLSSRFWKPMTAMTPCLIPADGFYEPKGEKGTKRPWFGFEMENSEPFFFAGLYGSQDIQESFVIITKEPNQVVSEIHSRMPVILDSTQIEKCEAWLDTKLPLAERIDSIQEPIEYANLTSFPVGDAVKNPRNEGSSLFDR